jgi:Leucine-rich repeat (LRR) protein
MKNERLLIEKPIVLFSLTSLVELHLSFNNLTSIPTSIGLLHSLQFLALDHNQIQSIPTSVRRLISKNLFSNYLK